MEGIILGGGRNREGKRILHKKWVTFSKSIVCFDLKKDTQVFASGHVCLYAFFC
jgi:hypothetical protein